MVFVSVLAAQSSALAIGLMPLGELICSTAAETFFLVGSFLVVR